MLRWWMTYEQTLLVKLIRFPLSTTPREHMLLLSAIRLVALSFAVLLIGLLSISVSVMANWEMVAAAGAVTLVVGLTLLTLTMALGTMLVFIYGD